MTPYLVTITRTDLTREKSGRIRRRRGFEPPLHTTFDVPAKTEREAIAEGMRRAMLFRLPSGDYLVEVPAKGDGPSWVLWMLPVVADVVEGCAYEIVPDDEKAGAE